MDKLNEFKLYLIQKGRSLSTVEKNLSCMRVLLKTLPDLQKKTLDQYFITHLEKGKSTAYLNIVVNCLRQWGEFTQDPSFKELKYFKLKETHKATMSDKEIEAFLSLPHYPGMNKRNYEIITLFFKVLAYSGMRPGEVAGLTVDSIDFGRSLFILDKTKTSPRQVPIAPTLVQSLTDHIAGVSNMVFQIKGKCLTRNMWQHYFDMRIARLGIKRKKLSCYSLRHSFITRWASEDINLFKIQRIVGHKKIETTANYMHLVTKDLTDAMKKDPLSRSSLSYYERLRLLRELLRKGIDDFCNSPEEEKTMLTDLFNLP